MQSTELLVAVNSSFATVSAPQAGQRVLQTGRMADATNCTGCRPALQAGCVVAAIMGLPYARNVITMRMFN
jgi:hypothetical protein